MEYQRKCFIGTYFDSVLMGVQLHVTGNILIVVITCRGIIVVITCRGIEWQGGGQHLERSNVDPKCTFIFEISNIKITKVELFDFSIIEFILYFYFYFKFYKHTKYVYDNLLNSKFLEF